MIYSQRASRIVQEFRARFTPTIDRPSARAQNNLQLVPEHELIITAKANSNGRILVVRCKCMAEYRDVSRRYYNYDPLGEAHSLDEVKSLYDAHLTKGK
jgi:hypothetical protein